MGFDHQLAQGYLQALKLEPLFIEALGWTKPPEKVAIATRAFKQPYRCYCIALRGDITIWEIKVKSTSPLTPKLRTRLYNTLRKKYSQPLIIFVDRSLTRSLWYWEQPWETDPALHPDRTQDKAHNLPQTETPSNQPEVSSPQVVHPQTVVYIPHQPIEFWRPRLKKLWAYRPETDTFSLLPDWPASNLCQTLAKTFNQHLTQMSDSILGMSNETDRRWYASLLVKRLIFTYLLQQQGLLDGGDIWYLHNRFGQSQQQGQNLFFKRYLQPLFNQGFSLPDLERPTSVNTLLGTVPYLGNRFYGHPLEQQYPDLNIQDAPFEAILVWFGEPIWDEILNPWQSAVLTYMLAQPGFEAIPGYYPIHPLGVAKSCESTLEQFILQQLGYQIGPEHPTLNDLLFTGKSSTCRRLIQEVLPQLSILDPACGTGTFLIAAFQRSVEIYSVLIGHLQGFQNSQLKIWLSGLQSEHPSLLQGIYRRILKKSLYGIDLSPIAIETTQFQLLMTLVATAHTLQDVEPLPSLDFNIMTGNSLVGFIRVDEQGFDRVKGFHHDQGEALQGNLLQPLVADSYRTILAEKNISLEHYQRQTFFLNEMQAIPNYAQLEFLRENINQLDQKAQAKLNDLLLAEFSQKLGIQFKETQLTDRPQRRLLTIADLELLQPFHWGYFFSTIIEQGGFSLILSAPPTAAVKPTVDEFFQHFCDLATRQGIDTKAFKTSKQALIETHPELAEAWLFYQSQYSFLTDYFYRAEQYAHQTPVVNGKRLRSQLRLDWLFAEQCLNLLTPQGICTIVVPSELGTHVKAEPLRTWLADQSDMTLSDSLPCLKEFPTSRDWSLLSFRKGTVD